MSTRRPRRYRWSAASSTCSRVAAAGLPGPRGDAGGPPAGRVVAPLVAIPSTLAASGAFETRRGLCLDNPQAGLIEALRTGDPGSGGEVDATTEQVPVPSRRFGPRRVRALGRGTPREREYPAGL